MSFAVIAVKLRQQLGSRLVPTRSLFPDRHHLAPRCTSTSPALCSFPLFSCLLLLSSDLCSSSPPLSRFLCLHFSWSHPLLLSYSLLTRFFSLVSLPFSSPLPAAPLGCFVRRARLEPETCPAGASLFPLLSFVSFASFLLLSFFFAPLSGLHTPLPRATDRGRRGYPPVRESCVVVLQIGRRCARRQRRKYVVDNVVQLFVRRP